jgi:hypothetical protein
MTRNARWGLVMVGCQDHQYESRLAPLQPLRGSAMSELIRLNEHQRSASKNRRYPIIQKIVDGELIECVNLDELTPAQYEKYLSQFPEESN